MSSFSPTSTAGADKILVWEKQLGIVLSVIRFLAFSMHHIASSSVTA
jgi:hypothetical protein